MWWQLTETIDVIEIIFTLCAVVALYYHGSGALEARKDLLVLRRAKRNSGLTIVAKQNILDDVLLGLIQSAFAFIGIWAMLQPFWWPVVATVPAMILLGAQVTVVFLSWSRRRVRWQLDEISRKKKP